LNKIKVSRLAGLAKGAEYIDVLAIKNSLGFNLSKKFYSVRTFKKNKDFDESGIYSTKI
jgi:hypothetical protein